ncbi:MAG: hypothetical protein HYZ72_12140 [Deltaproteobacteria bacterium]|nr:hypothetical protein [Deltaproteobacteria bacterium]
MICEENYRLLGEWHMHDVRVRVEWEETRGSEVFRILAEKHAEAWEFSDQSLGNEVRWYPLVARATLVAKAEDLVRGLGGGEAGLSKAA